MEFLFEVINERGEPLVFAFEVVKAGLRLREYRSLVRHERINTLIDMEMYTQLKLAQEHEDKLCSLIRSQKTVEKPPASAKVLSKGLQCLRTKATQRRQASVSFQDDELTGKALGALNKKKEKAKRDKSGGSGIFQLFKNILKFLGNILLNSRFSIDELISIARPVIYVYSVLRFGRRSYRPLKVSLFLDMV